MKCFFDLNEIFKLNFLRICLKNPDGKSTSNGAQKDTVNFKEIRAVPHGSIVLKWIAIPVVVGSSLISRPFICTP